MMSKYPTVTIHALAPAKPATGQSCNGCGVCCTLEPCPVSIFLFWPHQQPCRALTWDDASKRYLCGMVVVPSKHLKFFPSASDKYLSKLFKRWIAADQSCDSDVEYLES